MSLIIKMIAYVDLHAVEHFDWPSDLIYNLKTYIVAQ